MMFPSLASRALRGLGAALLSAGILAACGGSTSQLDAFIPARLIVLGDEYSALYDPTNSGNSRNFAMNGLDANDTTNTTVACADGNQALWVQRLASHYGLVFKECNPNLLAESQLQAFMLARYGATARALPQQVDDFQANITHDSINSRDMVTVLVGLHDIIEIYKDNIVFVSEADKLTEAETRGKLVAAQANRLANLGARVLISQVIDVGLTPYAFSEGSSEAALLTRLSNAFNRGARVELINDGTKIGLLALDDTLRTIVRFSGYNNSDLACSEDHVEPVSVVDDDSDGYIDGGGLIASCTTATISSDTAAGGNLWADAIHANARQLHSRLGSLAISRATANPF